MAADFDSRCLLLRAACMRYGSSRPGHHWILSIGSCGIWGCVVVMLKLASTGYDMDPWHSGRGLHPCPCLTPLAQSSVQAGAAQEREASAVIWLALMS